MKKIYQTKFGLPHGNCMAACIFSLLELDIPLESTPDFMTFDDWATAVNDWFKDKMIPYRLLSVEPNARLLTMIEGSIVIAGGPGPRGIDHAVLWKDGEIIHDPHPAGGGISKVVDFTMFFWTGEFPRYTGA